MHVPQGALAAIGDTPLIELRRVVPASSARVLVKLEWANPTGSMKDRMARAALEAAIADGRLRPGDTVVDYTAGTAPGGRPQRSARHRPQCAQRHQPRRALGRTLHGRQP
jgi:hypothetical protein